jgi:hypothetical protein
MAGLTIIALVLCLALLSLGNRAARGQRLRRER